MTNINLTAVLPDRDLTAPERIGAGDLTYVINDPDTRITRAGDIRITRAGDTRVARNTTAAYPPELTAVLVDRDLIAPERY